MFNFLNSAILVAAAAALLPFLLHLFSRRKVKVVPFSSIAYLKAMQKHQVRAIKIKQLLLLLIRTLIVLAIVLAFARPATQGGYLGSHAGVSAILIIDNSASMGCSSRDGRLFELGIKKAKSIVDMMGPADEVAVLATNGLYSAAADDDDFGNPQSALDILEKIELTDSRADIATSFEKARKRLAGRLNLNREIYLVSDFQETSFSSDIPTSDTVGKTYLVDIADDNFTNSGVIAVDLGGQLIEVGTQFPVTATVKSYTGDGPEDILLSLYLDGRRVSQDGLRLKPGESGQVTFALETANPGFHSGTVELSDDALVADNTYYFSFYIPDNFSVLLIGEDGLDTRMLRLALAPDEKLRRHWSVTQISYTSLASTRLSEYDVLYLINYPGLSEPDMARLRDYVKNGGGLFVNVGRLSDSSAFNRQMSDLTGITLTSSFPRQFSRSGFYSLSEFNMDHPILSVFKSENDSSPLSFKTFAMVKSRLSGNDGAAILARFSDGSPAMTINQFGTGRVMYLGCDMNPEISDLSLHPFFVPYLVRTSEYLSSGFSAAAETIVTGDSPRRALRKNFSVTNEFTLVLPDSTRRVIAADNRDNVKSIACGRLDKSGIYYIMNGAVESDRFAVVLPPEEGDLYRAGWDDLENRLRAARVPTSVSPAGFIAEQRFGRELWHYFIFAALLLLVLEMIIARDKGAPLTDE